jgi:carbon-monoxide dehydrogenase large subunit
MSDPHHAANRREDLRLITGQGRYASDWNFPNQLHAAFLRSDRAHAELLALDTSAAAKMPGVRGIFTGEDALAAGYTEFHNLLAIPGIDGQPIKRPQRPVLAANRVRYVGEPVAMVIADDALAAQDAAQAIEVRYRDLTPVVDPESAHALGAPQIHDNIPGNVCFEWEAGDKRATDAEFARAHHVTRLKLYSTRVAPNPMEPRACVVSHRPSDDSYDFYCCGQGMNILRKLLAVTARIPEERLRVHIKDVGGSFGQRGPVYPEHGALMIAAKRLARPAKWVSSRSEAFIADAHGRAITTDMELALDREGYFLAARLNLLADMGAYLTAAASASSIRNPSTCMTGVYRIPALYGRFRLVMTTTNPVAPYRGAGRPDMAYTIERLVDKAAQEMGLDPVELRRRNFIPRNAFPYKAMTGGVYDACDYRAVLDKALAAADWYGYPSRKALSEKAGKLHGIGIATVVENTGMGFFPKDQIELEFDSAGNVTVYTVSQSSGQGHETTFAMVVADTLGIAPDRVTVIEGPVGSALIGNHSGGSRTMAGAGSICKVAALRAVEQAKSVAAVELGVEPSQVQYTHGTFSARESPRQLVWMDIVRLQPKRKTFNVIGEGVVGSTFPNGCHIAEVEIDPDTGVSEIVAYTAVDDTGTVISHPIVEAQVHGAVTQGAGQVFGEHAVYDSHSGQLLTGSFMDYFMPRAGMIRTMTVADVPLPTQLNSTGAKGVGEAGCGGSLPALTNAVMDALGPLGIHHLDMPLTPAKLWHAINNAKRQQH